MLSRPPTPYGRPPRGRAPDVRDVVRWVAMNRVEWAELHHRLAAREVPVADQLEYFFASAPAWCGPDTREARE